jgi:hypothetical protein
MSRRWLLASGLCAAALAAQAAGMPTEVETGIRIQGSALSVLLADGRVVTGQALVGARLAYRESGHVTDVRIDAVETHPSDPELTVYRLSVPGPDGSRQDLCTPDLDGHRYALFQPGAWRADGSYDPHVPGYSLTCSSGAAGKCMVWGYKPWENTASGDSMLPYYQSCTRMVRADYCGDGRGFTRDGTRIDLFDPVGVNEPEPPARAMLFEAAWGPQGALCIAKPRLPHLNTLEAISAACPARRFLESQANCTEDGAAALGARILNRSE